jgi:hypothetical protein
MSSKAAEFVRVALLLAIVAVAYFAGTMIGASRVREEVGRRWFDVCDFGRDVPDCHAKMLEELGYDLPMYERRGHWPREAGR